MIYGDLRTVLQECKDEIMRNLSKRTRALLPHDARLGLAYQQLSEHDSELIGPVDLLLAGIAGLISSEPDGGGRVSQDLYDAIDELEASQDPHLLSVDWAGLRLAFRSFPQWGGHESD